jgi:copper chaperone CopZ
MEHKTVKIANMSCAHCVRTIETELAEIDGVYKAKADLSSQSIFIEWENPASWDTIKSALEDINYPPSN